MLDHIYMKHHLMQNMSTFEDPLEILVAMCRAVARGGIGGVVNPPNFCRINIFGKSGWPFGKLRQ